MRRFIVLLGLAASLAPASAQFQDLIDQGDRLVLKRDAPVTLALRAVPAKDAVAKLAEAVETTLTCAPALAERKVSIACRERAARGVVEGLARAVCGRWRKEGNGFVLEPVAPLDVLLPQELASELGAVVLRPDTAEAKQQALREFAAGLTPAQQTALAAPNGIAFSNLPPDQQQRLAWLAEGALGGASRALRDVSTGYEVSGRLGGELLRLRGKMLEMQMGDGSWGSWGSIDDAKPK